ncbi:MAG: UDP-N-acetylmuramate--L-alanine ligase [Acidaminococcaceae bacterium]|nr:UDP-N-acetylmuramate--L-alanine ligase [Acidaminococcaceae bacterium]
MLEGIKRIHFIGIGGVGMSAIAYVLLKRGFIVSGSDAASGQIAAMLSKEGAMVYIGHASCQVEGADAVVVSTAINADNPELEEAQKRKIPVLHRSDVLAALINAEKGVAVAGAHGKTTTSSMLACICSESGIKPTAIIGGIVASLGGNAVNGSGQVLVAEADESDGSFLKFHPHIAVVTNIENDHLDHYGNEENIYKAFAEFLDNVVEGGKAVLCFDNAKVRRLAGETRTTVLSYAIDCGEAECLAKNITYGPQGTSYDFFRRDERLARVELIVPGRHNVLNSLGALVAALELGIGLDKAIATLKRFTGAKRRFETKGKIAGIWVVDDYAHHPTEIKATLSAAKQTKPGRLICVFQPHRYTRTQLLIEEFTGAFEECDELILTEIYAAGEKPIQGVCGSGLCEEVIRKTAKKACFIPKLEDIGEYLLKNVKDGDLVITVGAGNIYTVGEQLVNQLERGTANE